MNKTQLWVKHADVHAAEWTPADAGDPEVHLIVNLPPAQNGDTFSVVVRYADAEWLAAHIEILTHYYKTVFPDGRPLELDLSEGEFQVRYESYDYPIAGRHCVREKGVQFLPPRTTRRDP